MKAENTSEFIHERISKSGSESVDHRRQVDNEEGKADDGISRRMRPVSVRNQAVYDFQTRQELVELLRRRQAGSNGEEFMEQQLQPDDAGEMGGKQGAFLRAGWSQSALFGRAASGKGIAVEVLGQYLQIGGEDAAIPTMARRVPDLLEKWIRQDPGEGLANLAEAMETLKAI